MRGIFQEDSLMRGLFQEDSLMLGLFQEDLFSGHYFKRICLADTISRGFP